jgi:hypothetical protein
LGTANLLEWLKTKNVEKIIYFLLMKFLVLRQKEFIGKKKIDLNHQILMLQQRLEKKC